MKVVKEHQTGQVTLIPIISSHPKSNTSETLLNHKQRYVIFLSSLERLTLIGSPENACPHCGAMELKRSLDEVYVYPQLECCINMVKQHCEWIWEELKTMSLISNWSEQEAIKVEQLYQHLHYLELRIKVLEPRGGT